MMIKLDEYLEKHQYNILKALADALGYTISDESLLKVRELVSNKLESMPTENEKMKFELDLIDALEAKDRNKVLGLFDMNEMNIFDGADIMEEFNYRCHVTNENIKNNLMDWLEENKVNYLIDSNGRFAIKFPTRNLEYALERKMESWKSKWDKGPIKKSVDPIEKKKRLELDKRAALVDSIDETFDDSNHTYPDSPQGAYDFLKNNATNIPDIRHCKFKADPAVDYVWLVLDTVHQVAFIVYLKDKDFEAVDYDRAKSRHFKESVTEAKKKKKTGKDLDKLSGGYNPAQELSKGQYQQKITPNKKQKLDKKQNKHKNKQFDEDVKLDEMVLGMTSMPSLNRIKQLAGLQADSIETNESED